METSNAVPAYKSNRTWIWVGAVLTVVGFLGHVFAARAIGGYAIAYQHHILGFFLILVVTSAIILALARFFWRGRNDITILAIGAVQAILGILVYVNGPHV